MTNEWHREPALSSEWVGWPATLMIWYTMQLSTKIRFPIPPVAKYRASHIVFREFTHNISSIHSRHGYALCGALYRARTPLPRAGVFIFVSFCHVLSSMMICCFSWCHGIRTFFVFVRLVRIIRWNIMTLTSFRKQLTSAASPSKTLVWNLILTYSTATILFTDDRRDPNTQRTHTKNWRENNIENGQQTVNTYTLGRIGYQTH